MTIGLTARSSRASIEMLESAFIEGAFSGLISASDFTNEHGEAFLEVLMVRISIHK